MSSPAFRYGSDETGCDELNEPTVADWQPFSDLSIPAKITCPVHMIAWQEDQLHPFELAQRVARALPDARLETIAPLPAIFVTPELVGRAFGRSLAS